MGVLSGRGRCGSEKRADGAGRPHWFGTVSGPDQPACGGHGWQRVDPPSVALSTTGPGAPPRTRVIPAAARPTHARPTVTRQRGVKRTRATTSPEAVARNDTESWVSRASTAGPDVSDGARVTR